MKKELSIKLQVLSEAIWVYTLIIWVYIAIENLFYPNAVLSEALSVYVPIKQNLLAVTSFFVSFVFFILWKYLKATQK
ncbi:MAG: hypothetical protein M1433_01380 [Candidatus Parvarchaeota archaeon]|nr:hypothetical protein [Candidatus Parvarchaeota archaeon]